MGDDPHSEGFEMGRRLKELEAILPEDYQKAVIFLMIAAIRIAVIHDMPSNHLLASFQRLLAEMEGATFVERMHS